MENSKGKEFGINLRRMRKELGLTLKQVSDKFDISVPQLSRFERYASKGGDIPQSQKVLDVYGALEAMLKDKEISEAGPSELFPEVESDKVTRDSKLLTGASVRDSVRDSVWGSVRGSYRDSTMDYEDWYPDDLTHSREPDTRFKEILAQSGFYLAVGAFIIAIFTLLKEVL